MLRYNNFVIILSLSCVVMFYDYFVFKKRDKTLSNYIWLYFLQLDLHEASKKQQVGPQKPNEDIAQFKRQLDDQTRKIEEQTRQVEEQRRNVDNKIKQVSEREKAIQENDKQLQRRKDQLDQLENSLKKVRYYINIVEGCL